MPGRTSCGRRRPHEPRTGSASFLSVSICQKDCWRWSSISGPIVVPSVPAVWTPERQPCDKGDPSAKKARENCGDTADGARCGAGPTPDADAAHAGSVTDAHGGFGGISQFNRDAIEAIAGFDTVERIDVLPRIADTAVGSLPENVHYHLGGVGGARRWIVNTVSQAIRLAPIDLVICGHVHLASAAVFVAKALRAPVALVVHGVEAWPETRRQMRLFPSNGIGALLSVSELTRDHILSWARFPASAPSSSPTPCIPRGWPAWARTKRWCGVTASRAKPF